MVQVSPYSQADIPFENPAKIEYDTVFLKALWAFVGPTDGEWWQAVARDLQERAWGRNAQVSAKPSSRLQPSSLFWQSGGSVLPPSRPFSSTRQKASAISLCSSLPLTWHPFLSVCSSLCVESQTSLYLLHETCRDGSIELDTAAPAFLPATAAFCDSDMSGEWQDHNIFKWVPVFSPRKWGSCPAVQPPLNVFPLGRHRMSQVLVRSRVTDGPGWFWVKSVRYIQISRWKGAWEHLKVKMFGVLPLVYMFLVFKLHWSK